MSARAVVRNPWAIVGVILTFALALGAFLGNLALDVREIKAQMGPPPHVLVDPDQAKSDHDLLIELRTDVRAIKAAVVVPGR